MDGNWCSSNVFRVRACSHCYIWTFLIVSTRQIKASFTCPPIPLPNPHQLHFPTTCPNSLLQRLLLEHVGVAGYISVFLTEKFVSKMCVILKCKIRLTEMLIKCVSLPSSLCHVLLHWKTFTLHLQYMHLDIVHTSKYICNQSIYACTPTMYMYLFYTLYGICICLIG